MLVVCLCSRLTTAHTRNTTRQHPLRVRDSCAFVYSEGRNFEQNAASSTQNLLFQLSAAMNEHTCGEILRNRHSWLQYILWHNFCDSKRSSSHLPANQSLGIINLLVRYMRCVCHHQRSESLRIHFQAKKNNPPHTCSRLFIFRVTYQVNNVQLKLSRTLFLTLKHQW